MDGIHVISLYKTDPWVDRRTLTKYVEKIKLNKKRPSRKKVKAVWITPDGLRSSGNVLLSQGQLLSTIAAERLNFRVRNGNGWIPLAIVTEKIG